MLMESIKVFEIILEQSQGKLVLDQYLPKDGTYHLVQLSPCGEMKTIKVLEIKLDKKSGSIQGQTDRYYPFISRLDYLSKLIEMNKPIDPKKVIHSNSYLSFAVKKESVTPQKLTQSIIDKYYQILENPSMKYQNSKEAVELYRQVEEDIGKVDQILLARVKSWIEGNIFNLSIDCKKKGYYKIFFVLEDIEETKRLYERENRRYLIPNLYNNNKYNIQSGEMILGLPNDNMGMNSKKPYLETKTRKTVVPYLLNQDEAVLHCKFFDYLSGIVAKGKNNVYIDLDNKKIQACSNQEFPSNFQFGYYLRLKKGKEVEIHDQEPIHGYSNALKEGFIYREILKNEWISEKDEEASYGTKSDYEEIQILLDQVLFDRKLVYNYFTEASEVKIPDACVKQIILETRGVIFNWLHKGQECFVPKVLERATLQLIINSIKQGYSAKAMKQLNLRWSIREYFNKEEKVEKLMDTVRGILRNHINSKENDITIAMDEEYYYAIGQLVGYYLSKSKGKKKSLDLINPILTARTDDVIKKKLNHLFIKYDYDIEVKDSRAKKLIGIVMGHTPTESIMQELIIAGVVDNSLV